MSNLLKIESLCRICCVTGTHNIENIIPFYMHANAEEIQCWLKPISVLISDVLNIPVLYTESYSTS